MAELGAHGWQGRIEDGCHVLRLRVYYEDTDATGVVYYANYLRFAERARTECLRAVGADHPQLLAEHGVVFVVRHCVADYRAPARLDDVVEARSRFTELRGASLRAAQSITRDGHEIVHIDVRLACVDRAGRPRRLPAALRQALATFA